VTLTAAAADQTDRFALRLPDVVGRAEIGDPVAQTYLGLAYELGEGVPQAPRAAARWYEQAADQGNSDAQLYLGAAYATGSGVPKDRILACKWLKLAMPHLTGPDKEAARQALDQVLWDMIPAQVAASERLERAWIEDHPESSGVARGFGGDR